MPFDDDNELQRLRCELQAITAERDRLLAENRCLIRLNTVFHIRVHVPISDEVVGDLFDFTLHVDPFCLNLRIGRRIGEPKTNRISRVYQR